ncbi:MAG: tRNA (N(6)-L-threonylcarbamoyladenosine(37)-C(2))-methylthiotransferase MtaB [Syntrophobacterales bacterium]|nr:tRNA (N(6)-L-threonylcarbamoyladenosine(37)-C(2))-methylthiotransferase MtaB [Syntrophobacterales bacterium]
MFSVAVATLGCKVNHYESAGIIEKLEADGISVVPFTSPADVYIVNTCTVTAKTDFQSRQLVRRAHRTNPAAPIIVTGCYAQTAPHELAELPGVRMVAGTEMKEKIPVIIQNITTEKQLINVSDIGLKRTLSDLPVTRFPGQTRAYLKIQDGCNAFCSYCIIPYARGRSRSLPQEDVIRQIQGLTETGHREIILTGIHIGEYGHDLPSSTSLLNLLKKIEEQTDLERLRVSSINPTEISDDMINHIRNSKIICRHLHISLQSGDDYILKSMKRHYSTDLFRGLVEKLQAAIPEIAIGTDVITGFPGEGEKEFLNTVGFIENLRLAYLHVFPYSQRPGTAASSFPDQVIKSVKKERSALLRDTDNRKRLKFNSGFIGKKLSVLVEGSRDKETGYVKGFSDNYVPVVIPEGDMSLANHIVQITGDHMIKEKVVGRIEKNG